MSEMTVEEKDRHLAEMARAAASQRTSGIVSGARPTAAAREVAQDSIVFDFFTNPRPAAERILNGDESSPMIGEHVSTQETEAPVAAPEPEPVAEATYEIPEGWADDDLEPDPELEPEPVVAYEAPDDDGYVDPKVAALQKQLAATEKRAEHERKLRVQTARTGWVAEAKKVFNKNVELLTDAELAGIDAESHRDFRAKAKAIADRNAEVAKRFAPTAVSPDAEAERAAKAAADAERWGAPVSGTPTADADSVGQQARLARARRSGRLADMLKVQIFPE